LAGNEEAVFEQKHPAYHNYGGRGITICVKWDIFANFLSDMGEVPPNHSLDRINNNGNYEPQNCRWATNEQQHRNTRRNRMIEYNGERLCLAEWEKRLGVGVGTIWRRIERGWPVGIALTRSVP
jgi:hypothetical protein